MPGKHAQKNIENWTKDYSTYFWHSPRLLEVKFEIERTTGLLLERDPEQTQRLVYSGSDKPPTIGRKVQLRFEAALPTGNWYSFLVNAWVPRTWYTKAEFLAYADRAFQYWRRNLQAAPSMDRLDSASEELYAQRAIEAVEETARLANQKEDPAPIRVLQQDVLEELRKGRSFRTAHHEGGTILHFDGKNFVRSNWGEEESREVLTTDDDMLDCIRAFYDWDSRKDSYPHRPPELEVWEFIKRQLM